MAPHTGTSASQQMLCFCLALPLSHARYVVKRWAMLKGRDAGAGGRPPAGAADGHPFGRTARGATLLLWVEGCSNHGLALWLLAAASAERLHEQAARGHLMHMAAAASVEAPDGALQLLRLLLATAPDLAATPNDDDVHSMRTPSHERLPYHPLQGLRQ